MCLNCREGNTLLFPERPVYGSALWLQAVRAVSIQEDYVKSLERKLTDPNRDVMQLKFIDDLLDDARNRLLSLQSTLKDADEGG